MLWHGGRTAPFGLQSFASFWKSSYILSFAYIPSTQSLKAAKLPLRFPGAGILLFAKGTPFAQFTKMSAKDGWAMLLWVHSAFRTFGVSCKSVLPSTVAQWNGLCLLLALQHLTNGYRAMQFCILARKCGVNTCAPVSYTHLQKRNIQQALLQQSHKVMMSTSMEKTRLPILCMGIRSRAHWINRSRRLICAGVWR